MQNNLKTHIDGIESLIRVIDPIESDFDTIVLSAVADNIILASGGLIEIAISETLYKYCKLEKNQRVSNFFLESMKKYNSFNWERIREVLKYFDDEWHKEINEKMGSDAIQAISRIKKNRDNIAHGTKTNIGYTTAKDLFLKAKLFARVLDEVVMGNE